MTIIIDDWFKFLTKERIKVFDKEFKEIEKLEIEKTKQKEPYNWELDFLFDN